MESHERFDEQMTKFIDEVSNFDLASDEAKTAMQNLKTFSECRPPAPEPEPIPDPVPVTKWEKFKAGAAKVLDNETTRTVVKVAGPVVSVVVVTYATIKKDHVIERQAMAQANQRNS